MIDVNSKPFPDLAPSTTRPFWPNAKAGRFVLQRCTQCATFQFHPKPWCIECGSRDLQWTDAKSGGTIYSFTVSRTVAMNYAGWEGELPVLMCLIDLDDGARMYAQVTHCEADAIHIGMRVRVYLEDIGQEAGIPKFRPE